MLSKGCSPFCLHNMPLPPPLPPLSIPPHRFRILGFNNATFDGTYMQEGYSVNGQPAFKHQGDRSKSTPPMDLWLCCDTERWQVQPTSAKGTRDGWAYSLNGLTGPWESPLWSEYVNGQWLTIQVVITGIQSLEDWNTIPPVPSNIPPPPHTYPPVPSNIPPPPPMVTCL